MSNIDIKQIVVPNNFPFGKQAFTYFIGYKDNKEIRTLCIFFPEKSIYKKYSDIKCMYFQKYIYSFIHNFIYIDEIFILQFQCHQIS